MVVLRPTQNDLEERKRYMHAQKNEIDVVKKVMSKLFVPILIASVLIGILTVIPENGSQSTVINIVNYTQYASGGMAKTNNKTLELNVTGCYDDSMPCNDSTANITNVNIGKNWPVGTDATSNYFPRVLSSTVEVMAGDTLRFDAKSPTERKLYIGTQDDVGMDGFEFNIMLESVAKRYNLTITSTDRGNVTDPREGNLNMSKNETRLLQPDETDTVYLHVSRATLGTYSVNATATSQADANVSDTKMFTTTVAEIYDVSLTANRYGAFVIPGENATYTLTVENTGNMNDHYNLNVTNPNNATTCGLGTERKMNLTTSTSTPGGTLEITLYVANLTGGVFPVNVTATSVNDPNATASLNTTTTVRPPVRNENTNESFDTIPAAIDAVNTKDGHTITADPRTYTENIEVTKQLAIMSTSGNPSDTIVQAANASKPVFNVTVDYVNISGFTATGATEWVWQPAAGIYLDRVEHCNISNNIVSNNDYGISLWYSSNNTLTNNAFANNGLFVYESYDTIVRDNTVNDKPLAYLEDVANNIILDAGQVVLVNCDNITAEKFDLSNASVGVELWGTDNCTIKNITALNNYCGIYFWNSSSNTLTNITASGVYDGYYTSVGFVSNEYSHNNVVEDFTLGSYPTTISFTYDNGIEIAFVTYPEPDPAGMKNISKYMDVHGWSDDSWIALNVNYDDADVINVIEDSLKLYHWNWTKTEWVEIHGSYVNTTENYVYANVTDFSQIAPFGIGTNLPVITNVQVTSKKTRSATITWTTDVLSNSTVEYGKTTAYGSTESDEAMNTSHSISLTGLSAGTTYHYKVKSANAAGMSESDDYTFTTKSAKKRGGCAGGGGGQRPDTDLDGYTDFDELQIGSDPYDPCDPNPESAACLALEGIAKVIEAQEPTTAPTTAPAAAPPTAAPPTAPSVSEIVVEELKKLSFGRILFTPHEKMKVGVKKRVEVRITRNTTEDLTEGLKGRGVPKIEKIKVGTFMKVRLIGDNFDIKPISHEEQIVGPEDFTQWSWDVVPIKSGIHELHLTVTVRILIPGQDEQKIDCKVMVKRISVEVNHPYTIKRIIGSYWQWIIGVCIIPIILKLVGRTRKK